MTSKIIRKKQKLYINDGTYGTLFDAVAGYWYNILGMRKIGFSLWVFDVGFK